MLFLYAGVALLTFLTAAAGDWLETKYVRSVSDGDREAAVRLSIAMYLCGLLGLVAFVQVGMWVIVPEVLGLYVGTTLAFRRQRETAHGN